jgi:septal ring factor EnvC (AmiA/AmiB activator)
MANEPEEEFEEDEVEEAPSRRPWVLIVICVVLAIVAAWTGTQWKLGVDREDRLRVELRKVYQEAEGLRTQTAQAQQKIAALEGQVASLAAEREDLNKRITEMEQRLRSPKARRPAPTPRR